MQKGQVTATRAFKCAAPKGKCCKRAGHTSGVVGDDCLHESWHDDSERGHSREANGMCDRERAQRFAVAKPCVTRVEAGKEEESCCTRTKKSQRWWRQCR